MNYQIPISYHYQSLSNTHTHSIFSIASVSSARGEASSTLAYHCVRAESVVSYNLSGIQQFSHILNYSLTANKYEEKHLECISYRIVSYRIFNHILCGCVCVSHISHTKCRRIFFLTTGFWMKLFYCFFFVCVCLLSLLFVISIKCKHAHLNTFEIKSIGLQPDI